MSKLSLEAKMCRRCSTLLYYTLLYFSLEYTHTLYCILQPRGRRGRRPQALPRSEGVDTKLHYSILLYYTIRDCNKLYYTQRQAIVRPSRPSRRKCVQPAQPPPRPCAALACPCAPTRAPTCAPPRDPRSARLRRYRLTSLSLYIYPVCILYSYL